MPVLGARIDVLTMVETVRRIAVWAKRRESRYVCICNVHSVVTASRDPQFLHILNEADLATPDGAPVAWVLRQYGAREQKRVSGPDLMIAYFDFAQSVGESVFLYGSTEATLKALRSRMAERWPRLRVAGSISPPFRHLSDDEERADINRINASGAGTVWVSLGCPKQETWMAKHRGSVNSPMLGVGAGFDFLAGTVPRAPSWMQATGLEWLHRLMCEPRRLWRRYLVTNTLFIIGVARQTLNGR